MYNNLSPSLQKIMAVGYGILLFWGLFTVAAPYTILPAALPYTKELILLAVLLLSVLLKNGLKPLNELSWSFILFHALILIYLPATFLSIGLIYESTVYIEKYFQAPLAILAAFNIQRLSGIRIDKWVHWYYLGAFALIALNFIGYFAPDLLLISYNHNNYPSRITLGQPTPVAYSLSLAFLYSVIVLPFSHKQALLSLVLLAGILVIVPGTTIAALIAIIPVMFFFRSRLAQGNQIRLLYFALCTLLLASVIVFLLSSTNPAIQYFVSLLELKIKAIFGLIEDPSLDMRQDRFDVSLHHFGPVFLFGTGLNSYVQFTSKMITHSVSMEHGFRAVLVNFGVIGLGLYLSYFVREICIALKHGRNSPYALLHLTVLINYLLHHFSLDVPFFYNLVIPTFFIQEFCKSRYYYNGVKNDT